MMPVQREHDKLWTHFSVYEELNTAIESIVPAWRSIDVKGHRVRQIHNRLHPPPPPKKKKSVYGAFSTTPTIKHSAFDHIEY